MVWQVKSLQFEPVVVLSHADRECKDCKQNTLGDYPTINDLKSKVGGFACEQSLRLSNSTESFARILHSLTWTAVVLVCCQTSSALQCRLSCLHASAS